METMMREGPLAAKGMIVLALCGACAAAEAPTAAPAAAATPADASVLFGAQENAQSAALSPDGKQVVVVGPGKGTVNGVYIIDIASGQMKPIARADGQPMRLSWCDWASSERLVCMEYGHVRDANKILDFSRMFAIDADGKNIVPLGRRDTSKQLYANQFDGHILDWLNGVDGKVMMSRNYVPEMSTGSLLASKEEGVGVDVVDTRTLKAINVEKPQPNVTYLSDGRGEVRVLTRYKTSGSDLLNGKVIHYYRAQGSRDWHELGTDDDNHTGIHPLAVDSGVNAAYVMKYLDGRRALYRMKLDDTRATELVFAHPRVDVSSVVTIGRNGRVIGAAYHTEVPQVQYFDPTYAQLAASLSRAMPQLPIVHFFGASADEQVLLIYAASDNNAGSLFVLDRKTMHMAPILMMRNGLAKTQLATVKPVTYPAADGTRVPGYLTLPPGVDKPAGLPALVLPHGGPASRDTWGFYWLAQYYANRGFAVLQPNFRGSSGFGNDWFVENGFQSWKIAVGDVVDGGRWLVSEGIANPQQLAILGWSYGGYAALQANVVDPALFKAVVAIAPVTDLGMLREEGQGFVNELLLNRYIGTGPHIEEGSPARHAEVFKAPVLMFHGDIDANVYIEESRAMDRALKRAGKQSELVVYPKLDHQLYDSAARADMLQKSFDFLQRSMRL